MEEKELDLEDINKSGDEAFESLVSDKFKLVHEKEKAEDDKELLKESYRNLMDILRKYCDLREEYYSLISLWIIGTYLHERFETYPYLFLNAMKGSGKTRLLRLITGLSYNGEMLTSLTEAVLFRDNGTLGIDEFEGLSKKESLRELLNAGYKKGNKVKRMKKVKTPDGEEQVVESFDVYRPIVMANIWGMENVLGDRCITLILERSDDLRVTKKIEHYENDQLYTSTHSTLKALFTPKPKTTIHQQKGDPKNEDSDDKNKKNVERGVECVGVMMPENVYKEWNNYIDHHYTTTHTPHTTHTTHTTHALLFKKINDADIDGRHLELSFPLFMISHLLGDKVLDNSIKSIKKIIQQKKEDDFTESRDVSLIDFISQEAEDNNFKAISSITRDFRGFLDDTSEWINIQWMGLALKRLNLIIERRRVRRGSEVILDIKKAQEKIKIFR